MPRMSITKHISECIKEKAASDKPIQEFIMELLRWELSTKGAYQFKDNYRQMIKNYSSRWEVPNENRTD